MDSVKKARALDRGRAVLWEREEGRRGERLRVCVQVNTSGEEGKSGCAPGEETVGLCRIVRDECPQLELRGLMTIGALARSKEGGDGNEDFLSLKRVRGEVERELGIGEGELALSMGMSGDFEGALREGSDEVRVGTGIFGERPAKGDGEVKGEVEGGKE